MTPHLRRRATRDAELPEQRLGPLAFTLVWVVLTLAVVTLDYATGREIRFPVLLLVPLSLVAWRHGRRWGLVMSVVLQLPRLAFNEMWNGSSNLYNVVLNSGIQLVTFAFVAVLVATVAQQKRELEKEVATLRGILPICMHCKKIRNDAGEWEQLESYISHHSEAQLSHGLCAECAAKHYPGLTDDKPHRS